MNEYRLYLRFANKAIERWVRNLLGFALGVLVAVLSPFMEKNPAKLLNALSPFMFSMTRITVAVFTWVDARRIYYAPTIGWPEATLAMANIFALPVLAALSKVSPEEVVAFGGKIVERFGIGAVAEAQPPHRGMDRDERDEDDERERP